MISCKIFFKNLKCSRACIFLSVLIFVDSSVLIFRPQKKRLVIINLTFALALQYDPIHHFYFLVQRLVWQEHYLWPCITSLYVSWVGFPIWRKKNVSFPRYSDLRIFDESTSFISDVIINPFDCFFIILGSMKMKIG